MDSSNDLRATFFDLFPEEAQALLEAKAEEVFDRVKDKVEAYIASAIPAIEEDAAKVEALAARVESGEAAVTDLSTQVVALRTKLSDLDRLRSALALGETVKSSRAEMISKINDGVSSAKVLANQAIRLHNDLTDKVTPLQEKVEKVSDKLDKLIDDLPEPFDDSSLQKDIKDLNSRLNSLPRGGNMNRNIAIGGNTSVLGRYTDLNIKPGANITLTYTNNNTTKYTDLTITAAGGGGGGGLSRSINSISTSQTAGNTSATDYVYVCSAGINLTMPDAVGNTNLYTIKNTSTSSVLVTTTGGETIDSSANLILSTQYTSVDLISDGSNWDIT